MSIEVKEAVAEAVGQLMAALAGSDPMIINMAVNVALDARIKVIDTSPYWRNRALLNLISAARYLWYARKSRSDFGIDASSINAALVAVETCLEAELEQLSREIAAAKAVA